MKMTRRHLFAALTLILALPFHQVQADSPSRILTLPQCLEMARQNNRTLQTAALDIQAASEQKSEAYTKYYPSISANVMAFQTFDKIIKGDGVYPQEIAMLGEQFAQMIGQPFSYDELNKGYSATISAVQPLYAGGQITAGNKLARIQQEVLILQRQLTEKEVLQRVTENYWQIAILKYNLSTLDAAEKQIENVMKDVEQYVKSGVTTRNALLQVRLRQQELASNRLKVENADHVLRMLLAQQIGCPSEKKDGSDLIDIDASAAEAVDPNSVYVPSYEAAMEREELQMAHYGVDAQKLQIQMERGKNLPSLAVGLMGYNTGFGGLSKNVKNYARTNMTNGLVFGTLSVPISSWWGGSHAIRRQKILLQQSRNQALDAQEQLRIDIESAWSNLVEAYKQIQIAEASVEEAAENLRMNTDQYRAGAVTISDLLDAETLNRQAQNQLSQAKVTYQIRLSDYQRKTR